MHTHIEPLARGAASDTSARGRPGRGGRARSCARRPESPPRALRFLRTDEGLVANLTLALDSGETLAAAHQRASAIEQRIHDTLPEIADVIVHTEP